MAMTGQLLYASAAPPRASLCPQEENIEDAATSLFWTKDTIENCKDTVLCNCNYIVINVSVSSHSS